MNVVALKQPQSLQEQTKRSWDDADKSDKDTVAKYIATGRLLIKLKKQVQLQVRQSRLFGSSHLRTRTR